jgi:hypothetical protein
MAQKKKTPSQKKAPARKGAAGKTAAPGGARTFAVTLGTDVHSLFFEVPFDVKEAFGHGRAKVAVTLVPAAGPKKGVGYAYRSTVSVYEGRPMVPVRAEHREGAGVLPGDRMKVILALDTAPRVVEVPAELAAALKKNRAAAEAWNKLSYSHQNEHALAIRGAKQPETRARRVEKALAMLLGR